MVQGIVTILAVIVALSLLPVAMLAALFGIVDYLADDEKLEEIGGTGHRGGSPDVSDGTTAGSGGAEESTGEYSIDPAEVSAAAEDGGGTATCPSCGTENDREYDFCGACAAEL